MDAAPAASGTRRWLALVGALLAQAVSVGATLASFGLFQRPVAESFDASRSAVQLGLTLFLPAQAIAGPLLGQLADQRGPRFVMLLGAVLSIGGFVGIWLGPSLLLVGLAFVTLGAVGTAALGPIPASKLVSDWFPEGRGAALGINGIGPSIGVFVTPPLVAQALTTWGWRVTALGLALAFALLLPLLIWLVRNAPRAPAPHAGAAPAAGAAAILAQRNFWVMAGSFGLSFAVLISLGSTYPPYADGRGLTGQQAAWLISASAVTGVLGSIGFGRLSDRIPRRSVVWLAQLPLIGSCAALALVPDTRWLLPLALVTGFAQGITALWTTLIGDHFAAEVFGRAMGLMAMFMVPLNMLFVQLPAWIFDAGRGYEPAFGIFAAAIACAALGLVALRPRVA